MIFIHNYFYIFYMWLQHSGAKCKLLTRNSEEPRFIFSVVSVVIPKG